MYRVIAGTYGGECVSAACFRHVPPRRGSASQAFTEFLLAVGNDHERLGLATATVAAVKRSCALAGSSELVVVSNGHHFGGAQLALS